jgi:hypothetical protein
LLAASAAKFGDHHRARHAVYDFAGVTLEHAHSRAAQAILRQKTDHIEERGTHFVIQILGREFLLSRVAESHHHV